jgi:hypothetical protein
MGGHHPGNKSDEDDGANAMRDRPVATNEQVEVR